MEKYPPPRQLSGKEQELVLSCQRWAVQMSLKYASFIINYAYPQLNNNRVFRWQIASELLGDAYFGLCIAAQRYDSSVGAFTTYAYHYIRKELIEGLHRVVCLLGARFGKGKKRIIRSFSTLQNWRHLNEDRNNDDFDVWGRDNIAEELAPLTPELDVLLRFILNKRQVRFIIWHIIDDRTLKDIGEEEGLTRQRVKQIIDRALTILRKDKGFMQALEKQWERKRQHFTADDFFGTGTGIKVA